MIFAMRHKSVLIDEVAEFFKIDTESSAGNSSLDLHSADFANLGHCADSSPALHPKFAKNHESQTENPSVVDSARGAESSEKFKSKKYIKSFCYFWLLPKVESHLPLNPNLPNNADSAKSQNLNKKELCEAPENSPASWCKKSDSKGAVVPPADFLLEAEKRGSPPKSEKAAAFWRVGGAGRGVQPFLREKSSENNSNESAESTLDSAKSTELILIDATLGLGGHSERLLDENPTLKIIGIDKDETALEFAKNRLKRFGARFSAVQGSNAEQIKQILRTHKNIYGILADLGISSPQVDNLERGFSVKSSVLDMRMDLGASLDAKFVLNNYPKDELARIFREFGEIKGAEKIANLIAESRRKSPIKSGEDLCKIVERHTKWRDGIHPATLIFQAIRIEVNNELGDLGEFLANIAHLKGTKVAIISFHSLEDRLVKRAFKAWSAGCVCDEGAMKCVCGGKNERGEIITKKPITPSAREIAANNRARSAKMRCFKFK